jgi:hypothetical protein
VFHGSSPVGDWSVLVERLDRTGVFARWQQREAALAGVPGPAYLPARTGREVDRAEADEVLGALVRVAAVDGGADPDAALVLVHLLSDGVLALTARLNRRRVSQYRRVLLLVVGELTCRIRSFPWRRRTRAFAANLLLDTKSAVLGELPVIAPDGGAPEIPVDPSDPVLTVPRDDSTDQDPGLDDLVRWAAVNDVVGADDLRILAALHEPAGYGTGRRHHIAAEFGISERTLRRRRDRTVLALRAAGPRFLQDNAA